MLDLTTEGCRMLQGGHTSGDSAELLTGLRNTTTPTPTRGSSGYARLLPLLLVA